MDLTEHRNGIQDEQIKNLAAGIGRIEEALAELKREGCAGLVALRANVRGLWWITGAVVIPVLLLLATGLLYVAVEASG